MSKSDSADKKIDRAIREMCGYVKLFRDEPITTIYLQPETVRNWQGQLHRLKAMDDSCQAKAIYNNEAVRLLASCFNLEY